MISTQIKQAKHLYTELMKIIHDIDKNEKPLPELKTYYYYDIFTALFKERQYFSEEFTCAEISEKITMLSKLLNEINNEKDKQHAIANNKHAFDRILETNHSRSLVNVEREVTESFYGQLCGAIVNLEYYEENKEHPNQGTLDFYLSIRKALNREKTLFHDFTNQEAYFKRDNLTSPVLKAISLVDTPQEIEHIIMSYKNHFDELIQETGANRSN